ncbi:MAG: hypothetical protein LBF40_05615 [Deltaproteobacteria bacterium]|nr:hypothetical protein [Deltaproteobacteria bacterium]
MLRADYKERVMLWTFRLELEDSVCIVGLSDFHPGNLTLIIYNFPDGSVTPDDVKILIELPNNIDEDENVRILADKVVKCIDTHLFLTGNSRDGIWH